MGTAAPDDFTEEIDAHLRMAIEEEGEAARRRFGNTTAIAERARERWRFVGFETLIKVLHHADLSMAASVREELRAIDPDLLILKISTVDRQLRDVLSLAIGIGANTVIFSAIDALMLRKLPVRDPHALAVVRIFIEQPGRPSFELTRPYPD